MIRTALLSFWHVHARGYIQQAKDHPDIELVACWDDDQERGRRGAETHGLEFVADLDELLARDDIDAVIVQTETRQHHDVIVRAARAGKHVISDKVLAPTIHEANELVAAADAAGIALVTGMPHLQHDYTLTIKSLIDSGALGDIVNIRMMNCHGQVLEGTLPDWFLEAGAACGGALVDMCHIVYLTPLFLGQRPAGVFSYFGHLTGLAIEDSAVVVADTSDGVHVSLEASFVTKGAPRFEIEVNGTEGSVLFRADSHPKGPGAPDDYVLEGRLKGEDAFHAVDLLPAGPTPMMQWAEHIRDSTCPYGNIERALDLSRIVEAAYRSAESGQPVRLDSLAE